MRNRHARSSPRKDRLNPDNRDRRRSSGTSSNNSSLNRAQILNNGDRNLGRRDRDLNSGSSGLDNRNRDLNSGSSNLDNRDRDLSNEVAHRGRNNRVGRRAVR